jgi:hypothetical protein
MTPGVGKHLLLDFVQSLGDADCHIALLSESCDLCPTDATFTGKGEVRAQGYGAGGKKLQGFSSGLDDGIAWAAWQNAEWQNATIRACGAVIYAKGWGNRIITIVDFGEEQRSTQGMFRVKFPAPGPNNAVFWLA